MTTAALPPDVSRDVSPDVSLGAPAPTGAPAGHDPRPAVRTTRVQALPRGARRPVRLVGGGLPWWRGWFRGRLVLGTALVLGLAGALAALLHAQLVQAAPAADVLRAYAVGFAVAALTGALLAALTCLALAAVHRWLRPQPVPDPLPLWVQHRARQRVQQRPVGTRQRGRNRTVRARRTG